MARSIEDDKAVDRLILDNVLSYAGHGPPRGLVPRAYPFRASGNHVASHSRPPRFFGGRDGDNPGRGGSGELYPPKRDDL